MHGDPERSLCKMKVLVIPDVHLKPQMFKQAAALLQAGVAGRAVCLMDIPDDWDKQFDIALYEETYDEAIRFAKKFPETAWCYGNHDLSYFWHCLESGYSSLADYTVQRKLLDLRAAVPENNPIRLRPQGRKMRLYKPRKLLQVVGHTPMDRITKEGNLISTDVFSTYRDGRPIGTEEFLLLDTLTWEYDGVKI